MTLKLITTVVGLLAFSLPTFPQSAKPSAGAGPSSHPVAPANPSTILNRDFNNMTKTGRKGDYLTGSVALEGGSLPWDPIPVTVTCDGQIRYTTATDPKGYFAIAPVEPLGATTIKADPKPVAARFLGCAVEAVFPGFNATPLPIANRNISDTPNIGTITLRREAGSADTAMSSTTASAPKDAVKSFQKARDDWLDKKPDRAQRDLQKAVEIYPQYAEAWYQLGKIQEASNSPEACNSFAKAVAADPKFALPNEHMASLAAQAANWPEVLNATNRALELAPRGTIQVWYFNALGNFQNQKMDVAEASAKNSLSMDPLHMQPNTEQLLAVILAQRGDSAGALEHLRNCLTYFPPGPDRELVKQQIAQIQPAVQAPK